MTGDRDASYVFVAVGVVILALLGLDALVDCRGPTGYWIEGIGGPSEPR